MSPTKTPLSMTLRLSVAWAALVAATGLSWWLGDAARSNQSSSNLALTGVIVTAFLKTWIVGFEFMELRGAPLWLRHAFDAWVVAVAAILLWVGLK